MAGNLVSIKTMLCLLLQTPVLSNSRLYGPLQLEKLSDRLLFVCALHECVDCIAHDHSVGNQHYFKPTNTSNYYRIPFVDISLFGRVRMHFSQTFSFSCSDNKGDFQNSATLFPNMLPKRNGKENSVKS
jgi:hypothetical protein